MFEPRPPIFVADRGDLTVHRSVQDALNYVEPWDVSESLEAFDADGHRLKIIAEGVKRTRRSVSGGTTRLDERAPGAAEPGALRAILKDYIKRVGPGRFGWNDQRLTTASLADLVSAVAAFCGYS